MYAKVIKKFKDKNTKEIYQKGSILELSAERNKEIHAVGNFIEPLKGKPGKDDIVIKVEDTPEQAEEPEQSEGAPTEDADPEEDVKGTLLDGATE